MRESRACVSYRIPLSPWLSVPVPLLVRALRGAGIGPTITEAFGMVATVEFDQNAPAEPRAHVHHMRSMKSSRCDFQEPWGGASAKPHNVCAAIGGALRAWLGVVEEPPPAAASIRGHHFPLRLHGPTPRPAVDDGANRLAAAPLCRGAAVPAYHISICGRIIDSIKQEKRTTSTASVCIIEHTRNAQESLVLQGQAA